MKFLHTMVRVRDLDAAMAFYCGILDMVEIRRVDHEEARFSLVFLAARDDVVQANADYSPTLELTYNWPSENGDTAAYHSGRNFGHLCYQVDNIYKFCQNLLDKGVVINRPPRDGHMAFIKSPDGVSIELLQKGSSLELTEPWQSMENTGSW